MQFSHLYSTDDLRSIITRIANIDVLDIAFIPGGGNNQIYCVTDRDGIKYALKRYSTRKNSGYDPLWREYSGLRFLSLNGIEQIPTPFGIEPKYRCALYQWLPGKPVVVPDDDDINALLEFVCKLQQLRSKPGVTDLGDATGNCSSRQALTEHVRMRRDKLREAAAFSRPLREFLREFDREFLRICDSKIPNNAENRLHKKIWPRSSHVLNPSDLGFHNTLKTVKGNMYFIDFEYFGWGHPAKLIADFLWHPRNNLSDEQAYRFRARAIHTLGETRPEILEQEIRFFLPLIGLAWCMILLNEFLVDGTRRRSFANAMSDPNQKRNEQLNKALQLLNRVRSTNE